MRAPRKRSRRWLARPLLFCAALLLLFEEWLWHGTARFLRDLRKIPAVATAVDWVRRRSPYQALAMFVLPVLSLLPLKGVIVLAFIRGHMLLGLAVLLLEKLIFTAVFAALYQLTAPALLKIHWVHRGQSLFLRVRSALHRWLDRQPLYREARGFLRRLRHRRGARGMRRRIVAAYRMQRRRSSRFCFSS
ncbi:MAG TPA: hypothetical protein VIK97_10555 [Casimicrobiaceae bacterium]